MKQIYRIILCLLAFSFPAVAEETKPSSGQVIEVANFPTQTIAPHSIYIWLPKDYAQSPKKRFPVIYMHDGQNLFDNAKAGYGVEWGIDEAVTRLSARGKMRPHIVVGIANTNARYAEYFPRKIFDMLPAEYQAVIAGMNGGPMQSDAYLAFIVRELKPYIDKNYRTLPNAGNTSIMGSSMGGLISLYAIAEYPQTFGQAAAVSVHWPLANPQEVEKNVKDAPQIVADAFARLFKQSDLKPHKNRIYMDHGTATLDQYYPPFALAVDKFMPSLGYVRDENWESRSFTGTEHNERAWSERVDIPLLFLDQGK